MKFKLIASCLTIMSLLVLTPTKVNAEWKKDNAGWWYTEGNSYAIGWRNINNKWYYFNSNGYMVNDTVINGKYINSSGEWINNNINDNNIISKAEFTKIVCNKMHELVNNHRKSNGETELIIDSNLDNSAYLKSKHMVNFKYFSHDYNGQNCFDLIYSLSGERANGENIAQNFLQNNVLTKSSAEDLAQRLFTQWKNSPGHNANMLRDTFTSFGFGIEIAPNGYVYATQHFKIDK